MLHWPKLLGVSLAIAGFLLLARIGRTLRRDKLADAVYDSSWEGCALVWFGLAMLIGGIVLAILGR